MPVYVYFCRSCEHTFDEFYRVADREEPLSKPCPNCNKENQIAIHLGTPMMIDSHKLAGRVKPRSDFKERIGQIKKGTPKNNIPDY